MQAKICQAAVLCVFIDTKILHNGPAMRKVQFDSWIRYSALCWLVLIPVYAVNVYFYYANANLGVTMVDGFLISLQDSVLWMLLSLVLVWIYQQFSVNWKGTKLAVLLVIACAVLVILHITIDGAVNILFGSWWEGYGSLAEFWLYVGLPKLLPNSLIVCVLMMSILLYGSIDERGQRLQISKSAETIAAHTGEWKPNGVITISQKNETLQFQFNEISHIESAGNYSCIQLAGDSQVIRRPLSVLIKELPPEWFVRIHRSSIVNILFIRKFRPTSHGDGEVELSLGKRLRVSRRYRSALEAALARNEVDN